MLCAWRGVGETSFEVEVGRVRRVCMRFGGFWVYFLGFVDLDDLLQNKFKSASARFVILGLRRYNIQGRGALRKFIYCI